MSSTYSVFIPRVFSNIRTNRISDTFHNLNIGDVEKVDLVAKTGKNGDSYNMAFVHFKGFYDTQEATDFRREVEDPEIKAKLVYEDPWFWLVLPFEAKEKPTTDETLNDNATVFQPQQQQQFQQPQMVQFYVMTPQGPMIQWGIPMMNMPPQEQAPVKQQSKHRNKQPRKRLNPPNSGAAVQPPVNVEEGEVVSDCDEN